MLRRHFAGEFVRSLRDNLKHFLPGLFSFCALFVFAGCRSGMAVVRGKVTQVSGNQMPSPDLPLGSPAQPFATRLALCPPVTANFSQANPQLLEQLPANTTIFKSNKDGSFTTRVKAGTYTLLVETGAGWWAPYVRGTTLYPITLERGRDTTLKLLVTVDAVY